MQAMDEETALLPVPYHSSLSNLFILMAITGYLRSRVGR